MRRASRIAIGVCLAATVAQGQEPPPNAPRITLPASDAKLAEEFSRLISIRELADGRALLVDNRDNRVVVADFRASSITGIGRVGSGPGEFRRAGPLIALSADSTLLADPGNGRWLLLSGSRIVGTIPADDRVVSLAPIPSGADRSGRILAQRFTIKMGGQVDSTALLLVSRASGRFDTVTKLGTLSMRVQPPVKSASTGVSVQRITISSWAAGEQGLLYEDGWIAVARLQPYRVEWYQPDGSRVAGPPLPFSPAPVDEREKRAHMQRQAEASGRPVQPTDSRSDWPDEIPPFSSVSSVLGQPSPALLSSPDGKLLIQRMPTASMDFPYYDVVGRDGRLHGQLVLNRNHKVLGFGARHVYVVMTDENGIERLQRHPWP